MNRQVIGLGAFIVILLVVSLIGLIHPSIDSYTFNLFKKHKMIRKSEHNFYGADRKACVEECVKAGGVSCGVVFKNCCRKGKCNEHSALTYNYEQVCDEYIAIRTCTEP